MKCSKQRDIVICLGRQAFLAGVLCLSRIAALGVLLIASMSQIQAAELRIAHCLYGCPKGSSSENHLILRPIYALSYNTRNKVADWAAYRVTSGSIGIASSLSRAVMIDDFVEETLSAGDFVNAEEAGFTRAQLVPLVNFAGTPYWNEVNYMSNAVARSQNLSLGAWYGLEWSIRNLVNREREVYVLTGPIFRDSPVVASLETQTQHRVPDAFFKVVVSADNRATAFIFDQDLPVHVHHCDTRAAIDEIETATGLEFFPENPRLVLGLLDTNLGCF
ncbi:DNA/RNA non-specific endonuclease [Gammaproteobacteria bacterium]|nr:DNA/RNA non-specific endonuclease [Gammaproteobacteria bacterium]